MEELEIAISCVIGMKNAICDRIEGCEEPFQGHKANNTKGKEVQYCTCY